jgi:rRNA maturation RNase YbeY
MTSESINEIEFHFEVTPDIKLSHYLKDWIIGSAKNEKKQIGVINYIFCNDSYLLKINQDYLNHDTYTDIITFDYSENDQINGDLFISLERIKENSNDLNINYLDELERVCIHGILHLCGYPDKKKEEALIMRQKEDFYLTLRPKL